MVIKIKVVYLHHQTRTTGRFPENRERNNMNTQSIYNGLDYTTKDINRNFKIKVNGIVNGKYKRKLMKRSEAYKWLSEQL